MDARLSPGSMIAWAIQRAGLDASLSIETMRAIMEAAPTYPEAWTLEEGHAFLMAHISR